MIVISRQGVWVESNMAVTPVSDHLRRFIVKSLIVVGAVAICVPILLTFYVSVFDEEFIVFPPKGFTFRWYMEAAMKFQTPALTSIGVSVAAVFGGLLLGVPCSIAIHRYRFLGRTTIINLMTAPLIVPGVALGIALAVYGIWITRHGIFDLRTSLLLLVLAHVLITLPWVVRLCIASLANYDSSIEEAAASLGARPFLVFWHTTLPAMRSGIAAAALFSFVVSFENLEMTLFLLKPGITTLPVSVLGYLSYKVDPLISALAVLQILFVAVTLIVVDRFFRIGRVII